MNLLAQQAHRPWPVPKRPWIMVQVWRDLLFAHWNVSRAAIRHLIPAQFELDTFGGDAWISVTPFHMSVRPRGLLPLPGMFDFPELNCRTYVTVGGKPGIFFFSLDTANRMAVWGARKFYHLPYFHARMRIEKRGDSFAYSSARGEAVWRATYAPTSSATYAQPGSMDYFLVERYCLYTFWRGRTYRGEIHHVPWPLQAASARIEENSVAEAAGIRVSGAPAGVSFARELKVLIWGLERIG
jgi:uncharacterized protein YqjF (DUF2071 family)